MRHLRHLRALTAQAAGVLGLVAVFAPVPVRAQNEVLPVSRVDALRAEIKAAQDSHADDGRLGELWRQLGVVYQNRMEDAPAEDAYARAITLLRASGPEASYADALHGLGTEYLNMNRNAEARKYLLAALAEYDKMHDPVNCAFIHQALGIELLFGSKFKDAIAEFTASVSLMNSLPVPHSEPTISSYLLRSGAEYHSGDTAHAIEDIAAARSLIEKSHLAPASIQNIAIALVQGAALTRTGQPDAGQSSVQQALRLAASRTDLPHEVQVRIRLAILREYSAALASAHRKDDAKRMDAEVKSLTSELPATCHGCTVGVGALGLR